MNQPIEEQLSALMDGELGRDETRFLLRRIESDRGLASRWMRYHVARQALRRQNLIAVRGDFASAVMAKLDAESAPAISRNVWLRWGSGGAIAAAVAVAALMVTKPSTEPETNPIAASVPATSAPTLQRPASVTTTATPQLASTNPAAQLSLVPNSPIQTTAASFGSDLTQTTTFDPRLQSYLIRHYEAAGATGESDFVPYILLAQPATAIESRPAQNR